MEVSCLLKWQAHSFLILQAAFSLRSSGCSQKSDIVPLTAPPLALSISQDCFSLKSLRDQQQPRLERLCLLKAGLVFGKERRGERGEWEMLWVSTRTQATLFGQCLILWCGWVVADSYSGLWDHFATAVYSLGPPPHQVLLWKIKHAHKISVSLKTIVSFSYHINEKVHRTMGYLWVVGVEARF